MSALGRLRRWMLGLSPDAVRFDRLGFGPCDVEVRRRLERVMACFAEGFGIALEHEDTQRAAAELRRRFDGHHVGFAFEGAGMCYALWDLALPWGGGRLRRVSEETAWRPHDFIMTVGAGFAVARLPWGLGSLDRYLESLDPMMAWCVPDGYGFHQGLFYRRDHVEGQKPAPGAFPGWARRLFDSGIGRSLWWSEATRGERIARIIDGFDPSRRAEMWCGLGVACAYAGGADEATEARLPELAGRYRAHLVSGAPFAARMRARGGNPSPVTERVCRRWLGRGAAEVAEWALVSARRVERSLAPAELRARCYAALRDAMLRDVENGLPTLATSAASPSEEKRRDAC